MALAILSASLSQASADQPVAIVIGPAGSDSADGTADRPLRTIEAARTAAERAGTHLIWLRGGTYRLRATLRFDEADNGSELAAFPGEIPLLDASALADRPAIEVVGASGFSLTGLTITNGALGISLRGCSDISLQGNQLSDSGTAILLDGTRDSTVRGNRIERSARSALEAKDGSDGNLIELNVMRGTGARASDGGGVFLHGANRNRIVRNVVEDTAGAGIIIANWNDATVNTDNSIEHNFVRRTNILSTDSGAIYLLGRSGVDMRTVVSNNVIEGTGGSGDAHTIGIYLDDSSSGIVVEGNVVRGIGTHGAQIHGGDDIVIQGNLFDLGSSAVSAVLLQPAPADTNPRNTVKNNKIVNNIVLTERSDAAVLTLIQTSQPENAGNIILCPTCSRSTTHLR